MTSKDNKWYSRDIMWREACVFKVDNFHCLTDDQYMECLQEVHRYWQQHRTHRIERKLVAGSGPHSCADRGEPSESYIGGELSIFKFFDDRIFQEELRGINAALTPSACSEKDFMLALQYTNNRMMNWVACRTLPVNERYAGPQFFGHRLEKERVEFVPSALNLQAHQTYDLERLRLVLYVAMCVRSGVVWMQILCKFGKIDFTLNVKCTVQANYFNVWILDFTEGLKRVSSNHMRTMVFSHSQL